MWYTSDREGYVVYTRGLCVVYERVIMCCIRGLGVVYERGMCGIRGLCVVYEDYVWYTSDKEDYVWYTRGFCVVYE